jgi:hypothetical protein
MKSQYPILNSFQDFDKLLKQINAGDQRLKDLMYYQLLYAQKERLRHQEKAKRQYRQKKTKEEQENERGKSDAGEGDQSEDKTHSSSV